MDSNHIRVPLERDGNHSAWDLAPGDLSRRAFIGGGAALGASIIAPRYAFALTPSYSAHALFDSVGICTHPCWRTTNWGSLAWENRLIESGVKHARGDLGHGAGADSGKAHLAKFFSSGGKLCALITGTNLDKASAQADIDYLATRIGAQYLSGIESVNEYNSPNNKKPSNWASQLREFQHWLYGAVRAKSALRSVPVIAPSIWGQLRTDYMALGNISSYANRDCMHYYTGGLRPTMAHISGSGDIPIRQAVADAHIIVPNKPLFTTEWGYDNPGTNNRLSGWVITPKATAKYIARGIFDLFTNGSEKTYIYSLMDDPGKNHYWGLCDANLRPKPQFNALKNTVALIKDNRSRVAGLSYTLSSNAPRDLKQYIFSKSDGSYLLVLYRDIDSYSRSTLKDIDAPPIYVTVNLGVSARKIEFYRPTFESACIGTASGKSILATVDDQVTIIKIIP